MRVALNFTLIIESFVLLYFTLCQYIYFVLCQFLSISEVKVIQNNAIRSKLGYLCDSTQVEGNLWCSMDVYTEAAPIYLIL